MFNPLRLAYTLRDSVLKGAKYKECLQPASDLLEECRKLLLEFMKTPGATPTKDINGRRKECIALKRQIDEALKDATDVGSLGTGGRGRG